MTDAQTLRFERKGYFVTRQLLQAAEVTHLKSGVDARICEHKLQALRQRIRVLCPKIDPTTVTDEAAAVRVLKRHGTDSVGFLQFFNLHKKCSAVKQVAFSKRMAGVAAQLLGAKRIRLYQVKEPGGKCA